MVLRLNSRGTKVKELQMFLEIGADGIFGRGTRSAVITWQRANNLDADGIVGPNTWNAMKPPTTDLSETQLPQYSDLEIHQHYLPKGEYKEGPINSEYVFIHHTSGWQNPYKTIDSWGRDTRGAIATEFIIGGQSVKGDDDSYDGEIVQSFPEGNYGWHLGKNGSQHMHENSVGIEVNNFSYLTKGGYEKRGRWVVKEENSYYTYVGSLVDESQIVTLDKPFKGHSTWHRYSDAQIESLMELILYVGERDNIDVRAGLPALIKKIGAEAFEFNADAYYGKIKGLWTHSNIRKDKFDMFPQQELLSMLTNL